ncbi:MAG TPA: hypothetical protein VJO16_13455 [Candidatus Acidoferrum sp.]|nr:hypothetical protein [Candidatus Acidoferrum sp.]
MKPIRHLAAFTGVALLLVSGWSSAARAQAPSAKSPSSLIETGCGYTPSEAPAAPAYPQRESREVQGHFRLASVRERNWDDDSDRAAIVGLWKIKFVSKGNTGIGIPDGAPIDDGYATWHSDGTEIMNSGRPPITSSFCMGVWKKAGRSSYKLNHFALSWDPTGKTLIGPANIKEEIVLDGTENSYSGTFTIDQYDTEGHLLAHISGLVSAKRITAD